MKSGNNDDAIAEFVGLMAEIKKVAETIAEAADDHFFTDPDEINWEHVGSATATRDALKDLLDRINQTGEYAPDAR